jgi:hypothetical protein
MNESNRTHSSNGLELSSLFVNADGKLSIFLGNTENEINGIIETPFGNAFRRRIGRIK